MTPNHTSTTPASTTPVTFAGAATCRGCRRAGRSAKIDQRRDHDAERLGVAGEQRVEAIQQPGDVSSAADEPAEHREAADVRDRCGVHRALVRLVHPATSPCERADERGDQERDHRRDAADEEVVADARCHGPSGYEVRGDDVSRGSRSAARAAPITGRRGRRGSGRRGRRPRLAHERQRSASSRSRRARAMSAAMAAISASVMPWVVTDGVPMRTPLVTNGLRGSSGIGVLVERDAGLVERRSARPCR